MMSGMGKGSILSVSVISSGGVFFLPNKRMSVSSAKGACGPFPRNRSIPLALLVD
jgi:hypothetical protein